MPSPLSLLHWIGKGVLQVSTGGVAGVVVDVGTSIVDYVWRNWKTDKNQQELLEEIQRVALASQAEMQAYVNQAIENLEESISSEQQAELQHYLLHVQSQIRRTLKRPTDPTGTTVPQGLQMQTPADLVPFLPEKLPRFQPGDRPLSNVDLEIVELLGVGGFGEVWMARNPHLQSAAPVALKFCTDEEAVKNLRHEAGVLDRVMRQSAHPGIVQLQQTYLSADPPCLQYEYVEGGDLAGLIREFDELTHPPTSQARTKILAMLTEIVAHAHQQTPPIVHRDLKPANILVQRSGTRVKLRVADFGIGGIAAQQDLRTTGTRTTSHSLTQSLAGSYTPLYASPEQSRGGPPDPRDDVYALGVIWYQMLTGDLTTGAPSGGRWRKQLAEQGLSAEAIDLLEACLETAADDRPADAQEVHTKLQRILQASSQQQDATRTKPEPVKPTVPVPAPIDPPAPTARSQRADTVKRAAAALEAQTVTKQDESLCLSLERLTQSMRIAEHTKQRWRFLPPFFCVFFLAVACYQIEFQGKGRVYYGKEAEKRFSVTSRDLKSDDWERIVDEKIRQEYAVRVSTARQTENSSQLFALASEIREAQQEFARSQRKQEFQNYLDRLKRQKWALGLKLGLCVLFGTTFFSWLRISGGRKHRKLAANLQEKLAKDFGPELQPLGGSEAMQQPHQVRALLGEVAKDTDHFTAHVQPMRKLAGVLAVLFGLFGAHKFYLRRMTTGFITLALFAAVMVAVTRFSLNDEMAIGTFAVLGGPIIILGMIEGVRYLRKSNEQFLQEYLGGEKEWF